MIKRCHTCAIHQPEHKEPLLPSSLPDRLWSRLGMDLLELLGKKNYLLIVDYYSMWMEVKLLSKPTSFAFIQQIKSVFAAQGIPDVVVSDNGPQFASYIFTEFATEYGFTHVMSSPKHPQTNGEAGRAVKTFKQLLKKNKDPYMALPMYRASPLQNGFSPAELLIRRKLQTKTPVLLKLLKPDTPDHTSIGKKETLMKAKQCENYNQRHAARNQSPLKIGGSVWIRDMKQHGDSASDNPRSFIINTPQEIIRRNRCAIIATPLAKDQVPACRPSTVPPAGMTSPNRPPVENNPSPHSAVQQTRREDPGPSTFRTRLHSTTYPTNPVQRDTVLQTRQEDPGPSTLGPSLHFTVPPQTLTNPVQTLLFFYTYRPKAIFSLWTANRETYKTKSIISTLVIVID